MNNFLTDSEFEDLTGIDIESLVASRLEDLAERYEYFVATKNTPLAKLIKEEGLMLAESFDRDDIFLFMKDSHSQL